eukprot:14191212-Alexandrium_andersonii.AAC.1
MGACRGHPKAVEELALQGTHRAAGKTNCTTRGVGSFLCGGNGCMREHPNNSWRVQPHDAGRR